jgi:hypothetical protein
MADRTSPVGQDVVDADTTTGAGTTTGTGMNTVGGQTSGGTLTGGLDANSVTTGNASRGAGQAAAIEDDHDDDDVRAQNVDRLPGGHDTETGSMTADTAALSGEASLVEDAAGEGADGAAGPGIDGGVR